MLLKLRPLLRTEVRGPLTRRYANPPSLSDRLRLWYSDDICSSNCTGFEKTGPSAGVYNATQALENAAIRRACSAAIQGFPTTSLIVSPDRLRHLRASR